jgi:hypothetical protein
MMSKGLIGRLLSLEAEELPPDAARESAAQLRTPTLDERANLYLRAVHGKQDFGSEDYSKARNRILNAMATDIAVKLGINPPDTSETPVDDDETQRLHALSGRRSEYAFQCTLTSMNLRWLGRCDSRLGQPSRVRSTGLRPLMWRCLGPVACMKRISPLLRQIQKLLRLGVSGSNFRCGQ